MLDLIERLERAEAGDRNLDADISIAVFDSQVKRERQMLPSFVHHMGDGYWSPIPPYTTSLDAIVALIGEKSPLRGPIHLDIAGSGFCALEPTDPCGDPVTAFGNTPALALCIALLRALQSKEADHGG